jgi:tRNA(His) 5'-end guanylyltransferase
MITDHPVLTSPEDKTQKLWRYMDFTKFVSLLSTSCLFFARADKLGDPWEGSVPKADRKAREHRFRSSPLKMDDATISRFVEFRGEVIKRFIEFTAINCWHANDHESAAMWKLYLKSNEGIAIQSTFERLAMCITDDFTEQVYLGMVKYVNYEEYRIGTPYGGFHWLEPFFHKRKSFEHEREVRAIVIRMPETPEGITRIDMPSPIEDGISVPVNLDTLIESVYLAPTIADWFAALATDVLQRYGVDKPVIRSHLDDVPSY